MCVGGEYVCVCVGGELCARYVCMDGVCVCVCAW